MIDLTSTESKTESKADITVKSSNASKGFIDKLIPFIIIITVGLAFMVGVLWQKVTMLESGAKTITSGNTVPAADGGNVGDKAGLDGKLSSDQSKKIPAITNEDHINGPKTARVFIIEYSDLQCPYCKSFHPTVKEVVTEYGDKVAWVYRHFPLTTIHPKAEPAAQASECVSEISDNDTFWKFLDKAFEGAPTSLDNLASIVGDLGVDSGAFNTCVSSGRYKDKVTKQMNGGSSAGVTGTPGNFVVNSKGEAWTLPGAVSKDSLKAVIDGALKD